jgi:hypothetical protein
LRVLVADDASDVGAGVRHDGLAPILDTALGNTALGESGAGCASGDGEDDNEKAAWHATPYEHGSWHRLI